MSPVGDHTAQGMSADNAAENLCVSEHLHSAELTTPPATNECHDGNSSNQGSEAALPNECMHHPETITKNLKERIKTSWQTLIEAKCQACEKMRQLE